MPTELRFSEGADSIPGPNLLLVGRSERLLADDVRALLPAPVASMWERMLHGLPTGDAGAVERTWCEHDSIDRVVACVLPEPCSRHNSPARPHAITELLNQALPARGDLSIVVALDEADHALAAACAVARAFPQYHHKGARPDARGVDVHLLPAAGSIRELALIEATAEGVRMAARLVDMPASELDTTGLLEQARDVAAEVGAEIHIIEGETLDEQGFGGLWGVGKAARKPPALAVLSHEPEGATQTLCWVGKGIVYDTGGLSIKGKANMPGMKADMGGSAAVLGAFWAAAKSGARQRIHAVLCLAENAVGPDATRPDDILTLYSGSTVEVNNTDAEGRLVLGDGVAYSAAHLNPDIIVDLATLTGAQLVATGKRHAAVICNDDALEERVTRAGRSSGDLVHPLPYCPEFYRREFKSEVADMKNSVKDRANAQSSCAAQFVAEHLGDFDGPWLHIDLAGPAGIGVRATGFGVALLMAMFVAGS
jgi:probable aminopeptidase NPEPL1